MSPLKPRKKNGFPHGPTILFVGGVLLSLGFGPAPILGQAQRTLGIHVGQTRSEQSWNSPISSGKTNGLSVGLNVDVPTPAPHLSIRVGIGYVQRGSRVWDQELDPGGAASAKIRAHYLTLPVHGKLVFGMGPTSAYLLAGPTVEQLLHTQCDEVFCRVITDERPLVLNLGVGSGLGVTVGDGFRGELEVRFVIGLTEAYRSATAGVHQRSLEFLVRTCFPF